MARAFLDPTFGIDPIGTAPPNYNRPKLTGQQQDEIRRRYADGETAKQLAAEFGVSTSTIERYKDPRR